MLDGAPYNVGGGSYGHYFLDDRIGFWLENDPTGRIWMDRARKINLAWTSETYPEWTPTIGDPRNLQDPAQRALGKIEGMVAAMRDLGVYGLLAVAGLSASAVLAFNLTPADSASSALASSAGSHVSVFQGERVAAPAVVADAPVGAVPELVFGIR